jgi:hypothetical protein
MADDMPSIIFKESAALDLGEYDFSEDVMDYRRIHVAIFNGQAIWRDSIGRFFRVDLQDDTDGRILLPQLGTNLIWENNLLLAAAESFFDGNVHLWPFGFHEDDEMTVPWNRWMPLTEAEKLARYTPL